MTQAEFVGAQEEAPGGRQNPAAGRGTGGLGPSVWEPRVPVMSVLLILGPEAVAQ